MGYHKYDDKYISGYCSFDDRGFLLFATQECNDLSIRGLIQQKKIDLINLELILLEKKTLEFKKRKEIISKKLNGK